MADGTSSADLFERGLLLRAATASDTKRVASFVASTADVDSYGTMLDQSSWTFARYEKNPVVLLNHDRERVIGRAVRFEVVKNRLEVDVEFAPVGLSDDADRTWGMVESGFLRGMSVGFEVDDVRSEKHAGDDVYRLTGLDLFEVSIVSIPSNPNTLAKARTRAAARNQPPAAPIQQELNMSDPVKTTSHEADLINARAAQTVAERELDVRNKAYADLEKRHADMSKAHGELSEAHESLKKRYADVEQRSTEQAVDALIGKKLAPTQRDAFIKLARADRASFDDIIKTMPDMGAVDTETKLAAGEQKRAAGGFDFTADIAEARGG